MCSISNFTQIIIIHFFAEFLFFLSLTGLVGRNKKQKYNEIYIHVYTYKIFMDSLQREVFSMIGKAGCV